MQAKKWQGHPAVDLSHTRFAVWPRAHYAHRRG
jgi:hypothetical protein